MFEARDMCVYFVKKFYPNFPNMELARLVGYGDDHTMISYSRDRYYNMMDTNVDSYHMKYNIALKAVEKWLAEN